MTLNLEIFNPSAYWRKGYVRTPWQPIYEQVGIPPEEVAVFTRYGAQLDTQVHEVVPGDPSRSVLVFWLDEAVPPGPDDYSLASSQVFVDTRAHAMRQDFLRLEPEGPEDQPYRVTLANDRLAVQFELTAAPWDNERNWYAGSATSVVLDGMEMLDAFRWWMFWEHDMEKRCMQVDRLRMSLPAWDAEPQADFGLIHQPYQLVSRSVGPVRASICVASAPFEYACGGPSGDAQPALSCRLHRVISVYRDADFVVDELFVRGGRAGSAESVSLYFTARYFMCMDLGLGIDPSKFFRIRDWFALGFSAAPFQGFGFATDAHSGPVVSPPPDYPDAGKRHKAFSWELERASEATCIHLFTFSHPKQLESRAGLAWYEYVYKPLRAAIS